MLKKRICIIICLILFILVTVLTFMYIMAENELETVSVSLSGYIEGQETYQIFSGEIVCHNDVYDDRQNISIYTRYKQTASEIIVENNSYRKEHCDMIIKQ